MLSSEHVVRSEDTERKSRKCEICHGSGVVDRSEKLDSSFLLVFGRSDCSYIRLTSRAATLYHSSLDCPDDTAIDKVTKLKDELDRP